MITKNEILKSGILDFEVFPLPDDVIFDGETAGDGSLLVVLAEGRNPVLDKFLEKVLAAVNRSFENDTLTVSLTSGQHFSFIGFVRKTGVQKAIFFGVTPLQAGLNLQIQKYELLRHNKISYLFADELSVIEQSSELKRCLWNALKEMFL